MAGGHVQSDRPGGFARLAQGGDDAHIFAARIEQHLRANGARIHCDILARIHLRRGRRRCRGDREKSRQGEKIPHRSQACFV
jgi:hypothetical protein